MAPRLPLKLLLLCLFPIFLAGCAGIAAPSGPSGGAASMPAILTAPSSQTVIAGQSATFSVAASGAAPLSYQWRRSSTNIVGATAASYTTPATSSSDDGSSFDVVVSNSKGSVTSSTAMLTVSAAAVAPTVTTQPASQAAAPGATVTFSVTASGTAPLSYQWRRNSANISGATSPSYTTPATTTADNGSIFDVMISNSKGSVTSSTATLTVSATAVPPTITTEPASLTAVTAGQTATFAVVASGTAPLSYQWQKNGTNISGATSPSYTTPATTTADNGSIFDVRVSNSKGSVTSSTATLTVNAAVAAPTITTQPGSGDCRANGNIRGRGQRDRPAQLSVAEERHEHQRGYIAQLHHTGHYYRR